MYWIGKHGYLEGWTDLLATGRIAGRFCILEQCEITFTRGVADSPLEMMLDCQFPYLHSFPAHIVDFLQAHWISMLLDHSKALWGILLPGFHAANFGFCCEKSRFRLS